MPRPAAKVVYVAAPPRKKAPKKKKAPGIGRMSGHGAYTYDKPGPWGRIGSNAGGMIGSALGSSYGLGKAGGAIGRKLGSYAHYIGKIFGSGDYVTSSGQVRQNTLINDAQIPMFSSSKNEVRIRHREFLCDIISSPTIGAFKLQAFAINPGLVASFPWLANVCSSTFQQYRINGMVFEYRSMSADALNSTNTALGQVIMATDYDSKDSLFTSKQQMENTEFGVSCKPSSCMIHGIECARNQTSVSELYVRAFAVPTGADPRLYDMGNFQIATNGCQAASVNLGELWVSYDISFFKAIEQTPNFSAPMALYKLSGTSTTGAQPFGALNSQVAVIDQLGLTFPLVNRVNMPYDIQIGSVWAISYLVVGASTAITCPTVNSGSGFTFINQFVGPSGTYTNTTYALTVYYYYAGGATALQPPYFVLTTAGTLPGTITDARLSIAQVSGSWPTGTAPGVSGL